jgi:hypothetical protein
MAEQRRVAPPFIRDNATELTEADYLGTRQPYFCSEIGRLFGNQRKLRLLMVGWLEPLQFLFTPSIQNVFSRMQEWAEDERKILDVDDGHLYEPGGPFHEIMRYTVAGHVASAVSWIVSSGADIVTDGSFGNRGQPSYQLPQAVAQALTLKKVGSPPAGVSMSHPSHKAWNQAWTDEYQRIQAEQAALMRCIYGNPFHPMPAIDAAWNTSTVATLAQSIYDGRAFDRLPILGDALEEAGCRDAEMLGHCRQAGPHGRGCWVVDHLLGKE